MTECREYSLRGACCIFCTICFLLGRFKFGPFGFRQMNSKPLKFLPSPKVNHAFQSIFDLELLRFHQSKTKFMLAARVFPRAIVWQSLPPRRQILARGAWRCSRALSFQSNSHLWLR